MDSRVLTLSQIEALLFNRRDRLGGLVQHDLHSRLKIDLWPLRRVYAVLGLEPLHEMTFIGGGTYYPPTNVTRFSLHQRELTEQRIEIELVKQEIRPMQQLGQNVITSSTPWSVTQRQNGDIEFRRLVVGVVMQGTQDDRGNSRQAADQTGTASGTV